MALSNIQPDTISTTLKLTKEVLGNYTWSILHTFASSYPIFPTNQDKMQIKNLITVL
jgi:hypothetical protein